MMYQERPSWTLDLDLTWMTLLDSAVCTEPLVSLVSPAVFLVSLRSPASESGSVAQLESAVKGPPHKHIHDNKNYDIVLLLYKLHRTHTLYIPCCIIVECILNY